MPLLEQDYNIRFTTRTVQFNLEMVNERFVGGGMRLTGGFLYYEQGGFLYDAEISDIKVLNEVKDKFVPVSERLQKDLEEQIREANNL